MKNKKTRLITILIFFLLIVVAVLVFLFIKSNTKTNIFSTTFFSMDTSASIKLYSNDNNCDKYKQIIVDTDKELDRYNSNSDIYKLNKNKSITNSKILTDIINSSKVLDEKYTNISFSAGELLSLWNFSDENPKVPDDSKIKASLKSINDDNVSLSGDAITLKGNTTLDFGAYAKGYVLDSIYKELKKSDEIAAVISLNSSSLLYGQKPDEEKFSTIIKDPDKTTNYVGTLMLDECFISSSGSYEREFTIDDKTYSHILDLKKGYPAKSDLVSVTVISKTSGILTDALSTQIYIDGSKNINKYLNDDSIQVLAITNDNKILISEDLKNEFSIHNTDYSYK